MEVGRLFGFRSTSPQLKQAVQEEIDYLVRDANLIELRNDRLYHVTLPEKARIGG